MALLIRCCARCTITSSGRGRLRALPRDATRPVRRHRFLNNNNKFFIFSLFSSIAATRAIIYILLCAGSGGLRHACSTFRADWRSFGVGVSKLWGCRYGDIGSETCAGFPGLGYDGGFAANARRMMEWGVDAFKVDGCNANFSDMKSTYPVRQRRHCLGPFLANSFEDFSIFFLEIFFFGDFDDYYYDYYFGGGL